MTETNVRLDKWLWAARFFKTRALAKTAIEGGKVHYQGARTKPSKLVELKAELRITQGWSERTVQVTGLSEQRRGAPEAQLLYQETEESIEKRQREAQQRKLQASSMAAPMQRPSKKQRRQIVRFKSQSTASGNNE